MFCWPLRAKPKAICISPRRRNPRCAAVRVMRAVLGCRAIACPLPIAPPVRPRGVKPTSRSACRQRYGTGDGYDLGRIPLSLPGEGDAVVPEPPCLRGDRDAAEEGDHLPGPA